MRYSIREITGQYAIAPNKGQKVYDKIVPALHAGQIIELDFDGVDIYATAFFNVAVGQLLQDFSPEELNHQLKFTNLNGDGQNILARVIENSKRYYSDPSYRKAVDSVMQEYAANC